MPIPAWAVSAALLLDHPDGLDIEKLTDLVIDTELSRLGNNTNRVEPYKVLWSALVHNCKHTDWFSSRPKWIQLEERDVALNHPDVQRAIKQINARRLAEVPPLPEEIIEGRSLIEGATKTIVVTAYERNPKARKACVEHYGAICSACDLDFAKKYGDLARGFIHVHHLKQLSLIGHDYVVDPIEDLRPICPNCHAVAHLGGKCRSIEEIKALLNNTDGDDGS